jgi:hypothetical protein
MYTIELTEGPGWDAPTLQARAIKTTVDIAKVTALAHWRPIGCTRCNKMHPIPTGPMAGESSMGVLIRPPNAALAADWLHEVQITSSFTAHAGKRMDDGQTE